MATAEGRENAKKYGDWAGLGVLGGHGQDSGFDSKLFEKQVEAVEQILLLFRTLTLAAV